MLDEHAGHVGPGARLVDVVGRGAEDRHDHGDDRATAAAIGRRLGIDDVVADVRPEGKTQALDALRRQHGPVASVGDGVNDAPALAAADAGLAVGTGTDVAIETADVVLMSGDLRGVVDAIALSRATLRDIRQNLFWTSPTTCC